MSDKTRAALTGGVAFGVLSALPVVNFVNICCCAWVLLGGGLAAYLYIQKSAAPVQIGEGAQVGALAGLAGTLIAWLVGTPLSLVFGDAFTRLWLDVMTRLNPQQADAIRQAVEQAQAQPLSQRLPVMIFSFLLGLVVYTAFATLGGILGVSLFEKRKGGTTDVPPPPPPTFGGPQQQPTQPPPPPGGYTGFGQGGGAGGV